MINVIRSARGDKNYPSNEDYEKWVSQIRQGIDVDKSFEKIISSIAGYCYAIAKEFARHIKDRQIEDFCQEAYITIWSIVTGKNQIEKSYFGYFIVSVKNRFCGIYHQYMRTQLSRYDNMLLCGLPYPHPYFAEKLEAYRARCEEKRIASLEKARKRRKRKKKRHEYYLLHREQCIAKTKQYAREHPDRVKEYQKTSQKRNRAKINARVAVWYEKNRERINTQRREKYAENRDTHLEHDRKYREEHRELFRVSNRKYREAHPEIIRERCKKEGLKRYSKTVLDKLSNKENILDYRLWDASAVNDCEGLMTAGDLSEFLEGLYLTDNGMKCVRSNLKADAENLLHWCHEQISNSRTEFSLIGENWFVQTEHCIFSIKASTGRLVTAYPLSNSPDSQYNK